MNIMKFIRNLNYKELFIKLTEFCFLSFFVLLSLIVIATPYYHNHVDPFNLKLDTIHIVGEDLTASDFLKHKTGVMAIVSIEENKAYVYDPYGMIYRQNSKLTFDGRFRYFNDEDYQLNNKNYILITDLLNLENNVFQNKNIINVFGNDSSFKTFGVEEIKALNYTQKLTGDTYVVFDTNNYNESDEKAYLTNLNYQVIKPQLLSTKMVGFMTKREQVSLSFLIISLIIYIYLVFKRTNSLLENSNNKFSELLEIRAFTSILKIIVSTIILLLLIPVFIRIDIGIFEILCVTIPLALIDFLPFIAKVPNSKGGKYNA